MAPRSKSRMEKFSPLRPKGFTTNSSRASPTGTSVRTRKSSRGTMPSVPDRSTVSPEQMIVPKFVPGSVCRSTEVPGFEMHASKASCRSIVISLPKSSTPPPPNRNGGLEKRPL